MTNDSDDSEVLITATHNHSDSQILVTLDHNPRLPNGVLVALLMVLGVIGNTLVLYIYHYKMPRSVFSTFVTVLAGLDLATALVGMPADVVMKTAMLSRTGVTDFVCKLVHLEVYSLSLASGGVLLLIALTRHTKVCHPTRPGLTVTQARRLSLLVLLTSTALCTVALVINGMEKLTLAVGERQVLFSNRMDHSPSTVNETGRRPSNIFQARQDQLLLLRRARDENNSQDLTVLTDGTTPLPTSPQTTGDSHQLTDQGKLTLTTHHRTVVEVVEVFICRTSEQHKGTELYMVLSGLLMLAFVAILLALVVLHCRIFRSLTDFKHRRSIDSQANVHARRMSLQAHPHLQPIESQHNLRHMTGTMFRVFAAITVIFVISYLPHLVCLVVEKAMFGSGRRIMTPGVRIALDLAYNFPYINVVANPFIYGYMSRRFRAHCARLLCRCCAEKFGSSDSDRK